MNERIQNYTEKLSKMIKYETVWTKDSYKEKFKGFQDEVLKKNFPNVFGKCDVEIFDGSLLIRWKGKSEKDPILFMNHQDVVPAKGDWTYPPFSATIADGKMWGRGTLDTKSGLFAMLEAADELIEEGFVPNQDVYFESACNEEIDGRGCDAISEELLKRGIKFKFSLDEGGMILYEPVKGAKAKYAMVGLAERGRAEIKLVARSNGGHASTPPSDTPLVRLGKMMAYIDDHNIFEVEVAPTIIEMLKRLSVSMTGPLAKVYGNADKFKPLLKKVMPKIPTTRALVETTIAFTQASGSEAPNVLPQTAYVICDMRTSIHEGYAHSLRALEEVAKKFDVEVETVIPPVESNVADFNGEGFKLAEKAIEEVYKGEVKTAPYYMNQCSDSRYISRVCDNCLRFTPFIIDAKQMGTIHGIDENIDIDNLDKSVDFYKYMMKA